MTDDQPESAPSSSRLRATSVLVAAAAILSVTGFAVWKIRVNRETSRLVATRGHFAVVALSLVTYSNVNGHLPYPIVLSEPDSQLTETSPMKGSDRELYSWRVEIVPLLEAWHGIWDRSRPWNDPANKSLIEESLFYSDSEYSSNLDRQSFPETNILAITGPGTAFGDGREPPMALTDVPPYTILAVETRASGIPWPAPGDFDVRTIPRSINAPDGKGISSSRLNAFHLIFANGQVWTVSGQVPFDTLKNFLTVADASKFDVEKMLGPYALHRWP